MYIHTCIDFCSNVSRLQLFKRGVGTPNTLLPPRQGLNLCAAPPCPTRVCSSFFSVFPPGCVCVSDRRHRLALRAYILHIIFAAHTRRRVYCEEMGLTTGQEFTEIDPTSRHVLIQSETTIF